MSEVVVEKAKSKMDKAISALDGEYTAIRAGRANPAILNKIVVDYYGTPTPIAQMAAISVPDPRTLQIAPWDVSSLKEIEKAIQSSDVGINPANDGKSLRLNIPPMTEEDRKKICKEIKKFAEEAKVSIRNARRDAMEKFKAQKKNNEITEDDLKLYEKDIQEETDNFCKEADKLATEKEKEIMSI